MGRNNRDCWGSWETSRINGEQWGGVRCALKLRQLTTRIYTSIRLKASKYWYVYVLEKTTPTLRFHRLKLVLNVFSHLPFESS